MPAAIHAPRSVAASAPQRLRALCYLDPVAEEAMGREIARAGGSDAPWGWLHAALVQARIGPIGHIGDEALSRARQGFTAAGHATGLAWCDEARAIRLRRQGEFAGSAALQAEIDARSDVYREPLYRFVALNSRALTAEVRGDQDLALSQLYGALDAALESGAPGPPITALANLGEHHLIHHNTEDACRLNEEALRRSLPERMTPIVTAAALNLVQTYYAMGEPRKARDMAAFLVENPGQVLPNVQRTHSPWLALGYLADGDVHTALEILKQHDPKDFGDGDQLCARAWVGARCQLALGDPEGARAIGEAFIAQRRLLQGSDQPFDMMELLEVLASACEQLGDHRAALAWQREAHGQYVQLVGRSVRARQIALKVGHQLSTARRERDRAVEEHEVAEADRRQLADLNAALQAKVAEIEQLQQQLQEQALRDPLTGLHNRRHLFEAGHPALHQARRQDDRVCVALLDLDHFKHLNDTCGHAAGDQALQRFAALLRQHLRSTDIVCRYGGEEFVAIMPGLDSDHAQAVLDRLQAALKQLARPADAWRGRGLSFSAGIARFPRDGITLEQLLARADEALYRAKRLGRSRVEHATAATAEDAD